MKLSNEEIVQLFGYFHAVNGEKQGTVVTCLTESILERVLTVRGIKIESLVIVKKD